MNTKILEYVIAVAEEKQQSRAAARLMVSQAALSQQIKKLEAELGTPLFYKEKNELLLTDAGKIYVNSARSVLSVYHTAVNDIKKIRTRKRRQISLVYSSSLLDGIPDVLAEFNRLHPDMYVSTVDVTAAIAREYLTNELADLAILATREHTPGLLEYVLLQEDELMLALPFDHPCVRDFRKNGVDFEKLKDEFFILNQSSSYMYHHCSRIFASHQFTPHSSCEIGDMRAARSMVINHKGIAFLPKSYYREGQYAAFSLDPPEIFQIAAVYSKSVVMTPAVRDLLRLLVRKYAPGA